MHISLSSFAVASHLQATIYTVRSTLYRNEPLAFCMSSMFSQSLVIKLSLYCRNLAVQDSVAVLEEKKRGRDEGTYYNLIEII